MYFPTPFIQNLSSFSLTDNAQALASQKSSKHG